MKRLIVASLAAAVLGACASAPERREPPPAAGEQAQRALQAGPPAITACASPVAIAIVIEAQPDGGGMGGMSGMGGMGGMGGMQSDPYSRLRIPPLVQIARRLADKSGCFRTLESDPALLAIPGGVQPDLALRVRAAALRVVERSLAEKAADAAKRYIGRYTGGAAPDPDTLQAAEVSLEFVCPRQRRVIQSFKGMANGALAEPTLTGERVETVPGANHERMAIAYAKAQDAALLFLRATPKPCD